MIHLRERKIKDLQITSVKMIGSNINIGINLIRVNYVGFDGFSREFRRYRTKIKIIKMIGNNTWENKLTVKWTNHNHNNNHEHQHPFLPIIPPLFERDAESLLDMPEREKVQDRGAHRHPLLVRFFHFLQIRLGRFLDHH